MAGELVPAASAPVNLPDSSPSSNAPDTSESQTNSTAPTGGLQGRDPDLIFEGEKILVNGKEYIVQKDDTLSGIAVKLGLAGKGNQKEIFNAVVKLANENGMDLTKMDQTGFEGLTTPTSTGPQPPNGGATATAPSAANGTAAPNNTPSTESTAAPDPGIQARIDKVLAEPKQKGNTIIGGDWNASRTEGLAGELTKATPTLNGLTPAEADELKTWLATNPTAPPSDARLTYLINKWTLIGGNYDV
jgi:pyruvate/2-oxoglutarate dehydrogenase complex dihydrolipoamide acyltransferase (E2) component